MCATGTAVGSIACLLLLRLTYTERSVAPTRSSVLLWGLLAAFVAEERAGLGTIPAKRFGILKIGSLSLKKISLNPES